MSFFKKIPTLSKEEEEVKLEEIGCETEKSDFKAMWLSAALSLWLPAVLAILALSAVIYFLFT